MGSIFDLLGIETKGQKQAREFKAADQALAERKFQASQDTEKRNRGQADFDRLQKLASSKDSGLSDKARQAIGLQLSKSPQLSGFTEQVRQGNRAQAEGFRESNKASLFDSLRSGELQLQDAPQAIQDAAREGQPLQDAANQPVNLFDFASSKPKIEGEFIEGTVTSTDKDGNVKVVQAPRSARDKAFERLTPEQQESAVTSSGQDINVNVNTKEAESVKGTPRNLLINDVIKLDKDINTIRGLRKTFEDDFLTFPGRVRSGGAAFLEKLNIPIAKTEEMLEKLGLVDEADADFVRRRSAFLLPAFTTLNEKIKEITGAAVREGEEGRLGQSTVDPTKDSPTQFRSKMDTVESIMMRQRKEKAILLERGLPYDKVNVESIPIDNIDSIYREEVLKLPQSPKQKLQNQANVVKQSNAKGNATIISAPSVNTNPQTLPDQIALRDVSKAVGKENGIIAEEFLTTHPKFINALQGAIKEGEIKRSSVGKFLKFIRDNKLSDEQVLNRFNEMRGSR